MQVKTISNTQINFQKLVPLKDYNGVILKLTKKDQAQIAKLVEKKNDYLFELAGVQGRLFKLKKTITREWRYLSMVEQKLVSTINIIDREIQQIKTNRLEKQKEKLKKLNTKA